MPFHSCLSNLLHLFVALDEVEHFGVVLKADRLPLQTLLLWATFERERERKRAREKESKNERELRRKRERKRVGDRGKMYETSGQVMYGCFVAVAATSLRGR